MKKDELGDRIKSQYEDRTRYFLPRRTYTIIRLDGKAFHSYTKNCKKPFDLDLIEDLNDAASCLMIEAQGSAFAYLQSDEISILLTDFKKPTTQAWFDGNVQKIASVSASIMTGEFNSYRMTRAVNEGNDFNTIEKNIIKCDNAFFDARVFTIPDPVEVANYFVWRCHDSSRNSVQMVARSMFSHKECNNKSCADLQSMLHTKWIDWNNYDPMLKRGRVIIPSTNKIEAPHHPNTFSYFKGLVDEFSKKEE